MRGAPPSIRGALVLLAGALAACCGSSGTGPTPPGAMLGAEPVPLSPVGGAQVSTDMPTFTVQNARGFDIGQAQYAFEVLTQGKGTVIAAVTVPAGRSTTAATFASPLPRGMSLAWRATAQGGAGQVASATALFRMPAVVCLPLTDGYARSVVDVFLPFCPQMPNIYNDPADVLGPYDAGGFGPFNFFGFLSLGDAGHVTVDMEACATDAAGPDLRVFQAVGSEPVTVYAAGTATGPFVLLEEDKRCGERIPGNQTTRFCDFDLGAGEVQEARYFKVVDAERFPCEDTGTPSEGADIDAVRILRAAP